MKLNRIATERIKTSAQSLDQLSGEAFVLVPTAWLGHRDHEECLAQVWLYRQAFLQAQAIVRPSIKEVFSRWLEN